MKNWMIIIALFSWSSVFAQNRVGNGGDVVKCKDSIQLLDFYESGRPLVSFENNDYKTVLRKVVERLERVNPKQAKQYKKRAQEIESEIDFKENIELVDISDSHHLFKPASGDCKILQAAVRKNYSMKDKSRFIINQTLWGQLNEVHKAGLLMHEIVYEHFYKLGEKDSIKARQFVALYFSPEFETMKVNDYFKALRDAKIPIYK